MQRSLGSRLLPRLALRSRAHAAASTAVVRAQAPKQNTHGRVSCGHPHRSVELRVIAARSSPTHRLLASRRSFAAKASEEKPAEEKPAEEKPSEEKTSEEKPSDEKPSEEKASEEASSQEKPPEEDIQAQIQERRRKVEEAKRKQQDKSQKIREEARQKVDEQKKRREAKKSDTAESTAAEAEPTPVQRLEAELEEFTERSRTKKKELLLALADFENNKKKFSKEREARRRTATSNFARRMVDVYQEFEAIEAFKLGDEAAKAELSEASVALQEGVSLTRDLLASAMEKGNVERFQADPGQPVVALRHEVVGSVPGDGNLPTDSVAEVTEPGWALDPRSANPVILRRAKVKTVGDAAQAETAATE